MADRDGPAELAAPPATRRYRSRQGNPHVRPWLWDYPPLTRREVIWACRPALLAIAGALDDQRQPISAAALRQLKTFLCHPSVSPLFGSDPGAARRAAQQLQHSFTGHPEP
jgi:hypothetical protein